MQPGHVDVVSWLQSFLVSNLTQSLLCSWLFVVPPSSLFVRLGLFLLYNMTSSDYCSVLLRATRVSLTSRHCVKVLSIKLQFK